MIRGICMHNPDYALVVIDAIAGITATTREHFLIAFAYGVPVIIVVNKADMVTNDALFDLQENVRRLHSEVTDKILFEVDSDDNTNLSSRIIIRENVTLFF
jgi:GTPase